jgi:hypothetical protein
MNWFFLCRSLQNLHSLSDTGHNSFSDVGLYKFSVCLMQVIINSLFV